MSVVGVVTGLAPGLVLVAASAEGESDSASTITPVPVVAVEIALTGARFALKPVIEATRFDA